ncbi:sugar transferase [Gordonia jinghuaiqii]|uniref:sugar transferase n=1 Tax=Gordonia jinghuaiqii TaxID=2758710 RepID=UPI001FD0680F|nr:sugar transferase [Gordonia jinghuaiqii]
MRYVRRLAWTDAILVIGAVAFAQIFRFGPGSLTPASGKFGVSSVLISVGLIAAWLVALRVGGTLDRRIVGSGSEEYSRVTTSCLAVFGTLAIVDLLLKLDVARGFLAIALPLGTFGLLVSRWAWRQRLGWQRLKGIHLDQLLVVGTERSAKPLIERLVADPALGFEVVGVCLPPGESTRMSHVTVGDKEVSVYGDFDDVTRAIFASGATTIAVTSAEAIGHRAMQDLSWELQDAYVEMLVSPGVTDVAGPRMLVRPVAGLPLLHIDKPRYEGANRFRKLMLDKLVAAAVLIAISPVLLAVAIAVKLDSKGPVFYKATRVGVGNKPFLMWKFRSMVQDAEAQKDDLAAQNEGAGVLFKMRADPRVTRVGKFIRRYSLDELPQLLNVLGGSMSLVGPRPPLPEEVARYDGRVARRMLVKPGITGLWQVSGRSDLSWEESVRLDLSYVENWSIMQDFIILWRTVKAVFAKEGAY